MNQAIPPDATPEQCRLRSRIRQISIGKCTSEYYNYIERVSITTRTLNYNHPVTPDIHQVCSKKAFEKQVRRWRRRLHRWDVI